MRVAGMLLVGTLLNPAGFAQAACDLQLDWMATYISPANQDAIAYDVATDGSGNIIVVGYEYRMDLGQNRNWLIRKYNSTGVLVWSKTYNSPANSWDNITRVAVDSSANIIVVGEENRPDLGQGDNWRIRKYDSAGVLMWSKTLNTPSVNSGDTAWGVAVDASNNIVVVGTAPTGIWLITKFDSGGTALWSQVYVSPGINAGPTGVAIDGSGNVIVVGHHDRSDLGQGDNWLIQKYNSAGTLLWSETYNSPANDNDYPQDVAVDGENNIIVVGDENRTDLGQEENWLVRKYDPDGNLLWSQSYDSSTNSPDVAQAVAIDGAGNVVVAGDDRPDPLDTGRRNFLIRIYDSSGVFLSSTRYYEFAGPGLDTNAYGVAVDSSGNIVGVGVEDQPTDDHWLIRKYNYPCVAGIPALTAPVETGKVIAAPNILDLSNPSSEVHCHVKGDPSGQVKVRFYDSAGHYMGELTAILDTSGVGSVTYTVEGIGGKRPRPGAYWALAEGGGVKSKIPFFVKWRK